MPYSDHKSQNSLQSYSEASDNHNYTQQSHQQAHSDPDNDNKQNNQNQQISVVSLEYQQNEQNLAQSAMQNKPTQINLQEQVILTENFTPYTIHKSSKDSPNKQKHNGKIIANSIQTMILNEKKQDYICETKQCEQIENQSITTICNKNQILKNSKNEKKHKSRVPTDPINYTNNTQQKYDSVRGRRKSEQSDRLNQFENIKKLRVQIINKSKNRRQSKSLVRLPKISKNRYCDSQKILNSPQCVQRKSTQSTMKASVLKNMSEYSDKNIGQIGQNSKRNASGTKINLIHKSGNTQYMRQLRLKMAQQRSKNSSRLTNKSSVKTISETSQSKISYKNYLPQIRSQLKKPQKHIQRLQGSQIQQILNKYQNKSQRMLQFDKKSGQYEKLAIDGIMKLKIGDDYIKVLEQQSDIDYNFAKALRMRIAQASIIQ